MFNGITVPCFKRCKDIEYLEEQEKIIESSDADGGWVDTHHYANLTEQVHEMTLKDNGKTGGASNSKTVAEHEDEEDDDGEPEDMDNYMAGDMIEESDEVFLH